MAKAGWRQGGSSWAPATGPDGEPLPASAIVGSRLSLTFRGPLPQLLDWLAKQPLDDLKVEPQGLGPIYRSVHG